jgi:hypothetical protein
MVHSVQTKMQNRVVGPREVGFVMVPFQDAEVRSRSARNVQSATNRLLLVLEPALVDRYETIPPTHGGPMAEVRSS